MSRRLHRCLACEVSGPTPSSPFAPRRGFTRHDDRICSHCRRRGIHVDGEHVVVPLELRLHPRRPRLTLLTSDPLDPARPTLKEVADGLDLTDALSWHGTDCTCPPCVRDRIPGRYA